MSNTSLHISPSPANWYGSQLLERRSDWTFRWSGEQIQEISQALEVLKRSGLGNEQITPEHFPLSEVGLFLRAIREQLVNGLGLCLIKGFPVDRFTIAEIEQVFIGLGSHLGNKRIQNAQGDLLGHVRDEGLSSEDPNVRIYRTNERQTFHTDSCDVVGLFCLKSAKSGGLSMVVSGETIYQEMYHVRPDLLRVLMEPVATDRRGETPEGMKPYCLIPIYNYHEGRLTNFYQRQYIESAQRFSDAPRLTPKHKAAMDLFDQLCNDPDIHIKMQLEPGDIQLVNNHALLHDRTRFEDWDDPEEKRHLLRLWLSVPEDRPLPEVFKQRYGSVEIGNRGGVYQNN